MYGLIIDTSSSQGFICLCQGEKILSSQKLSFGRDLSKDLFSTLEKVLQNIPFENLSYVAVGMGPGSYTGTRAGVSAAKSFAFSRQIPVIPFCSLLTYAPQETASFAVFMKAKNGSYFVMEGFHGNILTYNLHENLSEEAFSNTVKNKTLIEAFMEGAISPNYAEIARYCDQEFLEKKKDPFNLSLFYLHTP